ncbi:hypothetical protein OG520_37960 [Streptomyces sp. NBC_00984]|uniref:hypothetical protein n=1 Tax=Streptomyces sp. NBC_00984 TaxID=2903700 RepID=UPI00386C68D0|nr:hypothetical protein OG520_37960 [Streptomyces sp. NBC_00984]
MAGGEVDGRFQPLLPLGCFCLLLFLVRLDLLLVALLEVGVVEAVVVVHPADRLELFGVCTESGDQRAEPVAPLPSFQTMRAKPRCWSARVTLGR